MKNGKPKLIAYASKRLPEAARNYSNTELEMCGLVMNIASFTHLLKRVDSNAIPLTHLIRSKVEPTTSRIERLLEILSSYSFNLYYIKGKDMVCSDFLYRQRHDDNNPQEMIPISSKMQSILQFKYYNLGKEKVGKYLVQTRSHAKSSGICLLGVHGIGKGLNPNILPEKQVMEPLMTS